MWNPDSYRDTDYGLAEDEPFEPVDSASGDDEADVRQPYIQTVLGRIVPEDAGLALVHEHLHSNPEGIEIRSDDFRLNEQFAALTDLEVFFTVGGRTLVDATIASGGRSAPALQWLAQRAPVHIVASTGINLERNADYQVHVETIEREIREGIDGTHVKPGMLVVELGGAPPDREALAGIAALCRQVRLPLMLDGAPLSSAVEALAGLIDAGVPAEDVIVGTFAGSCDTEIVRECAAFGTYLLFQSMGSGNRDDEATAVCIAELVRDGMPDRILLSHGFARRSLLTGYGGRPGLGYIIEQFAIMLLEAGVGAEDVRRLLIENAASALSIPPQ